MADEVKLEDQVKELQAAEDIRLKEILDTARPVNLNRDIKDYRDKLEVSNTTQSGGKKDWSVLIST